MAAAVPAGMAISTHALTWSATYGTLSEVSDVEISTHALTWSATIPAFGQTLTEFDFNSRTHVECDKISGGIRNAR